MSEVNERGEDVLENGVLEIDSFSKGTGEISVISASELTAVDMTSDVALEESALGFGEGEACAPQHESINTDQSTQQGTEIALEDNVPTCLEPVDKAAVLHEEDNNSDARDSEQVSKHSPMETSSAENNLNNNSIEKVSPIPEDGQVIIMDENQSELNEGGPKKTAITLDEQGEIEGKGNGEMQAEGHVVLESESSDSRKLKEREDLSNVGTDQLEQEQASGPSLVGDATLSHGEVTDVTPVTVEDAQSTQSGKGTSELLPPSSSTAGSMATPTLPEGTKSDNQKDDDLNNEEGCSQKSESGGSQKSGNQPEWVDILGSGELQKKVLQRGKGLSTRPTQQSRVKLRVRGILHSVDGPDKAVDRHSAVSFTVGDGDVIQAWDIAVTLMELGEVARVKTSARFAYGEIGKPPSIPGNAPLTYELELLEVNPPLLFIDITEQQLVDLVEVKKTRGNELYKREEYSKALNSYHKGLQAVQSYLDSHTLTPANAPPGISELLIRCQNNIAATQLKVGNYKESLSACVAVLELDGDNVKALYRAGRVLGHLGEWSDAVLRLEKAAILDPSNKVVQTELQKTIKKKESSDKREKEMYRRMVGGTTKKDTISNSTSGSIDSSSWGPWPYLAISGVAAMLAIGAAYVITQRP